MEKPTIGIKRVHADAKIPFYATEGAAGADLCAVFDDGYDGVRIQPGQRILVSTGLIFDIPEGYEVQVRPRSGLAVKKGLTVLNAPGTIDSDYRGEIGVILVNLGDEAVQIETGDRIAQMVVAPVVRTEFKLVSNVSETFRDAGGFGSTGAK